jgi:hydrogenase/urease accessory protein HupE
MRRWLLGAWLLGLGALAGAHENLPASLLIEEQQAFEFSVSWRVPTVQGGAALGIVPRFPADCVALAAPTEIFATSSRITHSQLRCSQGLGDGARIVFEGMPATMVNALVRVGYLDGRSVSLIASPQSAQVELSLASQGRVDVGGYFALGVEHILGGIDHLLFVFCLVLLVRGRWRLLQTITAFTLAHSISLVAATLGYVQVPSAPVEASIALSIVLLACELLRPASRQGLAARWPWLLAFCFGLLHGLGFAGALSEVGLPAGGIPLALLLFNLGVEAGQLLFVGAVLMVLAALRRLRGAWPQWLRQVPAYAVGSVSAFWLLQRMAVLLGVQGA